MSRFLLIRRRAVVTAGVVLAAAVAGVGIWAFFTGGAVAGSYGAASADALPGAPTPTVARSGRDVTVSWEQQSFRGSPLGSLAHGGYVVTRYALADLDTPVTAAAGCAGTRTGSGDPLGCTENGVATGRWQYTITNTYYDWRSEGSPSTPIVMAPAAPATVTLVNGGGVAGAYINSDNKSQLSVDVALPATSLSSDTVELTLTDVGSAHTVTESAPATDGTGTLHFTGIDASSLNDGTITLSAVATSSYDDDSPAATASSVKDTAAPANALSLTGNSPSGSVYRDGTTIFYRGTGGGSGGSFKIRNAVTDTGSGAYSSSTAALGGTATGWSHTPSTVNTPSGGPFDSNNFSWAEGASSSPTEVVTGSDAAGNTTAAPELSFTNDSTAPSSTASVSPDPNGAGWNKANVAVDLDASDSGSGVRGITYSATGAQSISSTTVNGSSASITVDTEGTTTISFFATDNVGNVEVTHTQVVKLDKTVPSTTDDTASIGNAWKNTNETVHLTPTDSTSGVGHTYYTTDGSTPTTGSSEGTSISLTSDGVYTIKYFSVDVAGNAEPVRTAGTQIRVDKTAPDTATLANQPAFIKNGHVLTGSAHDDLSGVDTVSYYRCAGTSCTPSTLIGSSTTGSSYPVTWSSQPADGSYQVLARVRDNAGNTSDSSKQTLKIDNTPPVTSDNADSSWHSSAVTVTLSPSDGSGSGVGSTSYSIDGGSSQSGTSVSVSAPSNHSNDGIHTITYHSTDNLGNVESNRTATVKIDTTNPASTASGNDSSWHSSAVTVHLAATDPGFSSNPQTGSGVDSIKYTVDGGGQQSIAGSAGTASGDVTITAPSNGSNDGVHTITYHAVDNAVPANAESNASATVKIDTQPPSTSDDTSSIGNGWKNTNQTVHLTPTDSNSGVAHTYYTTDGSTPTASSSEGTSISLTSNGTYTIKYFSIDVAGDAESVKTAGTQIRIDKTNPSVDAAVVANTLTNQPGFVKSTGAYFVYANVSDSGGSGVSTVTANLSSLGNGSAVTLTTGSCPCVVGGTTYSYKSAQQTASTGDGNKSPSVTVTDAATNSASSSFGVTVDTVSPAVPAQVIADAVSGTAGFVKAGQGYFVYANASDASAGIDSVTADVHNLTSGVTAANMTFCSLCYLIGATQYSYRSAQQTAGAGLADATTQNSTVTATDKAGNSFTTANFGTKVDNAAPTTTDNTASIGNGWKTTNQTVTLTPSDGTGSGVAHTYYTSDGSTPTASSSDGTSVALTNDGVYTVKYFSADKLGNSESVKTAGTQIRVDKTAPSGTFSNPSNGVSYTSGTWSASAFNGTSSDATSGVNTLTFNLSRTFDNSCYRTNGNNWGASCPNSLSQSPTANWSRPISFAVMTTNMSSGQTSSYTATITVTDVAGNTSTVSITFSITR